jgi:hypothetical protein
MKSPADTTGANSAANRRGTKNLTVLSVNDSLYNANGTAVTNSLARAARFEPESLSRETSTLWRLARSLFRIEMIGPLFDEGRAGWRSFGGRSVLEGSPRHFAVCGSFMEGVGNTN